MADPLRVKAGPAESVEDATALLLRLLESSAAPAFRDKPKHSEEDSRTISALATRCTPAAMTELSLSNCRLQVAGAVLIAKALAVCTGLTALDLSHNRLTGPFPHTATALIKTYLVPVTQA